MKNIIKTGLFTFFLSAASMTAAIIIQLKGETVTNGRCSYLDPIAIDIFAFMAALFLIIEGMYKIVENKKTPLKEQITRAVRIAFGCSILTLHVMQVMTKYRPW